MPKYFQVQSPKGKYSKFVHVTTRHQMACCDCGLVHDMLFRAFERKKIKGVVHVRLLPAAKFTVGYKARRNEKRTAAKRRENAKRKQ